jgi:hypothetical protein
MRSRAATTVRRGKESSGRPVVGVCSTPESVTAAWRPLRTNRSHLGRGADVIARWQMRKSRARRWRPGRPWCSRAIGEGSGSLRSRRKHKAARAIVCTNEFSAPRSASQRIPSSCAIRGGALAPGNRQPAAARPLCSSTDSLVHDADNAARLLAVGMNLANGGVEPAGD